MAEQIYQFPNISSLQNKHLFLINDVSTVNHQIRNIKSTQIENSIFKRDTNTYTPVFSDVVNMTVSNFNSQYIALYNTVGNWAQVTINVTLQVTNASASLSATVPFGGNLIAVNDAVCVGGALFLPPTGSASGTFVSKISAIPGTNKVTINLYANSSVLNVSARCAMSFIYLIR